MLIADGVYKKFSIHEVLSNVSFKASVGEITALLGPNGAGKTTTLKILSGQEEPLSGSVLVDSISLQKNPLLAKQKIGYVPEVPALYEEMSVFQYVTFAAQLKIQDATAWSQAVYDCIESVGLSEVKHRLIGSLSKGFRQRVSLAQAIVHQPQLLLLDEPMNGFDPQQASEFKSLLQKMKSHMAILISTHLLTDVEQICDQLVVLNKGCVVAKGSLAELYSRKQRLERILLKVDQESAKFEESVTDLEHVDSCKFDKSGNHYELSCQSEINTDEILSLAIKNELGVRSVNRSSEDLSDLFLHLTKEESP